jgi:hypothetical protein
VRPYLENPFTKNGWWTGSRFKPWFKPQYCKKKKKIDIIKIRTTVI